MASDGCSIGERDSYSGGLVGAISSAHYQAKNRTVKNPSRRSCYTFLGLVKTRVWGKTALREPKREKSSRNLSFISMKFLGNIRLDQIQTFLPQSLVPKEPKYFVWFTGTLGQAEWLISHSRHLRGNALPLSCPKSPSDTDVLIPWNLLPPKIKPLMSLEQPDLMVSDAWGNPLISIEITEQQPVGLNAQQRMARFWSAVANRVPSAYLLPIEGYQIEKATSGAISAFNEKDPNRRDLLLRVAQLPNLTLAAAKLAGANTVSDLEALISKGLIKLQPESLKDFQDHVDKHLLQKGEVVHIKEVDVSEYIHKVGSGFQKAYIRKAGIPGSMLLAWFKTCNSIVPSAAFQLPISYKTLFRSNGRVHTLQDEKNPHLSYRNLPPAPGSFPPVNKRVNADEITLFFRMLDSILGKEEVRDIGREELTKDNEFYSMQNISDQQIVISKSPEFENLKSADFRTKSTTLELLLKQGNCKNLPGLKSILNHYNEFSIYKIYCGAATRSLGDPYTGALAVRDIIFTRDLDSLAGSNLLDFKRKSGLVFWVDLVKEATKSHKFLALKVESVYKNNFGPDVKLSTQDKIVKIIKEMRAEDVPKDIRAHLLFSDVIVVRRNKSNISSLDAYLGVPSLLRLGIINKEAKFLESLRI